MKKLLFVFLLCLGLISVAPKTTHAQNVQNFTFSKFEANYYLSKDSEGRATLRVVEVLVAEFPDFNQNKGLVRAIPKTYDGHSLSFKLEYLKRGINSEPLYDSYSKNNFEVIETGTDEYVTGTQRYEIAYTLRDVVKDFNSHQEFFWDVNGDQWQQRFDQVVARVYLDESIKGSFVGEIGCFAGSSGSQQKCDNSTINDDEVLFSQITPLSAGQTLSLVMKFEPNTFEPYNAGAAGVVRQATAWFAVVMTILLFAWAVRFRYKKSRSEREQDIIIPQYMPPKDVPLWEFAATTVARKKPGKLIPAQIIELAVKKKIKILEEEKQTLIFKSKHYTLELLNSTGLNANEQAVISILFGSGAQAGAQYKMKKHDNTKGLRFQKLVSSAINENVLKQGYRKKFPIAKSFYLLLVAGMVSALTAAILSEKIEAQDKLLFISIVSFIVLIFTAVIALNNRHLTAKGWQLHNHMMGLKEYMTLAEADRIKFLQSPSGAEKDLHKRNSKQKIVKLYEELLPYAVLLGLEKQWAEVLDVYYKETATTPSFYVGAHAFNASSFASSMQSFTSTSSSSSGFSGGGGAGGGGGGGGGGGR